MNATNDEVLENHRCRIIAETLCSVTKDILWDYIKTWAYEKKPGLDFSCRVGSGRATHHKHSGLKHEITYGIEMVRSKHRPSEIARWTTGKEILKRGYYGGRLSLLNAIAHTANHELSHLVQVVLGQRYDGSVHNDEFYTILDRLYSNPVASQVRHEINIRTRAQDVVLSHIPLITQEEIDQKKKVKVGDIVQTNFQGSIFIGQVTEVRRTMCLVEGREQCQGMTIETSKLELEPVVDMEDPVEKALMELEFD